MNSSNFNSKKITTPQYTKARIELIKEVVYKSDQVVTDIFHFINKTLDQPTKQEIVVYRKAILNLLNHKNDEKFKYIYEIASRSVYEQEAKEEKIILELKNDVILNPNIFSVSWEDISKNIRNQFLDKNDLSPDSIKAAFTEEHKRMVDLRNKINKIIELGISVPEAEDLAITERTFLKLTDLVNIFLSENFQDVGAMVQEIEAFEKRYSLDDTSAGSVFMDANYKTISNLSAPKFPGDAVNKYYVDEAIDGLRKLLIDPIKK